MRTVRGLFERLLAPGHLELALDRTVRGKRRRPDVAWLLFRRTQELERLRQELATGAYRPAGCELVCVRDPKPRVISRAPIADRVIHTALFLLLEPVFTRSLRPEVFACRPGFGTHRAVLRLRELMRRQRFVVHLDIRAYFPSIDLEILRGLLRRRVRDERLLAVVDAVLEVGSRPYLRPEVRRWARLPAVAEGAGRGLPIGALTSQLFAAHVYLDELDHHIKRVLRVPGYVRYLDDLFCFGDHRADLRSWRAAIGEWLQAERHVQLKHPTARILACAGHLDALGYRIRREAHQALPRVLRRLQRRVRLAVRPGPRVRPGPDLGRSLASSAGVILF